jgi:predicted permease
MKLSEAWHLSRIPYKEVVYQSLAEERGRMWWGAFGRSQGNEGLNDLELAQRALRIARFDKSIVAFFNVIMAVIPFVPYFLGTADFGLASSIALSLIITFGFTALYAIQTLSSFVGAESSALLSTLPIARGDFSLITLFSFIRSVDYMVIGSILSQVIVVAYITRSPLSIPIILLASVLNEVFATTVALWFSRIFQKNLMRGGRSRAATALRLIFILMWGLLFATVGFLFTIPFYIAPNLDGLLLQLSNLSIILSFFYPFSIGVVVAGLIKSNVALIVTEIASISLAVYVLLALLASRWDLGTVKSISQGTGMKIARVTAVAFSVKPRSQLLGYIMKDLKISSRNPATAFFFVLPLLETMIITLLISSTGIMRIISVLVSTAMGAIFVLFLPFALLTAEGKGLEYTKTLPISSRKIVASKALLSTTVYASVPLALIVLSFFRPLTSPSAILIPFFTIVSVTSASIFEIFLFLRNTGRGQISAIVNDVEKMSVGSLFVIIPLFVYALVFLLSFNQGPSILAMGLVILAEFAMALYILKNS